jgi:hypothetical protein
MLQNRETVMQNRRRPSAVFSVTPCCTSQRQIRPELAHTAHTSDVCMLFVFFFLYGNFRIVPPYTTRQCYSYNSKVVQLHHYSSKYGSNPGTELPAASFNELPNRSSGSLGVAAPLYVAISFDLKSFDGQLFHPTKGLLNHTPRGFSI